MSAGLDVHGFTVVSNEPAADGLMRIVFRAPELAAALAPGQFVNIHVPGDASQILRVPLSFSCADAAAGTVEIVYAVVGDGTRRLSEMATGETSTAVGPCGNPWPSVEGARRACVVAGGVGRPLRPVEGHAVTGAYGGRTAEKTIKRAFSAHSIGRGQLLAVAVPAL